MTYTADESVTLRHAASLMREQHGPNHPRHKMWQAMADLLDGVAGQWGVIDRRNALAAESGGPVRTTAHLEDSLAVALAYLGGDNRG